MGWSISSIYFCPVKSLSFSSLDSCSVKKNLGILNDRIFSFSRNIDLSKAKTIETNPKERKLNNFLTLKNTPILNKYNFSYNNKNYLQLTFNGENIFSISLNNEFEVAKLESKIIEISNSLIKSTFFLKNENYPFFDTTHSEKVSNSISLINLNSIDDFQKRINQRVEFERFRGNFYVKGINPWEERNWIDKVIKINKVHFKVESHIKRCSVINLKPKSDDGKINLPYLLKKNYNHIDMGLYLTALEDGNVNIDDIIELT